LRDFELRFARPARNAPIPTRRIAVNAKPAPPMIGAVADPGAAPA
jgi:hypothetical protein